VTAILCWAAKNSLRGTTLLQEWKRQYHQSFIRLQYKRDRIAGLQLKGGIFAISILKGRELPDFSSTKRWLARLKRQCHEIFWFWFFSWISFPQAPEYTSRAVSNFFENSRRYSQLKVDHRYQRHRWQTMGLISGCRYLKVNLKAKMFICVNSTFQRCPNKIIKRFLMQDFSHLPPVSTTPVVNLELRISPRIFEKFRSGPNGILWGWGETDWCKKTRSEKSRDTVPLSWFFDSLKGEFVDFCAKTQA